MYMHIYTIYIYIYVRRGLRERFDTAARSRSLGCLGRGGPKSHPRSTISYYSIV